MILAKTAPAGSMMLAIHTQQFLEQLPYRYPRTTHVWGMRPERRGPTPENLGPGGTVFHRTR
jgi:hypothetical protein